MSDSFLKSMTFTTPGDFLDRDCDCEECDNIPIDIRNAIQKRKRLRLQTGPIKRTQQRTLINRHNIINSKASIITLWSISMPKNAEPLVEFGSSHRILWVKRIGRRNKNEDNKNYNNKNYNNNNNNNNNKCTANNDSRNSILQSIGRGIIGSSDEEKSRKYLHDFTEGSVFLVPSNGGKAIGWIHTSTAADGTNTGDATDTSNDFLSNNYDDEEREEKKNDQEIEEKKKNDNNNTNDDDDDNVLITSPTSTEDKNDGYAVLYVAKIPLDVLDQEKDDDDDDGDDDNWKWVRPLIKGCRDGLESITVGGDNPPLYYKFSDDTTKILQKAMLEAERTSPKY